MKKRFTRILAALALLVFMTPNMVAWGQTRADEVIYTLEPVATGGNSAPHNSYAAEATVTINSIEWAVMGNSSMVPWRIGGKNISDVNRPIYSKTAIQDNVTKIEVTHGAASSITVNSWTLIVASDANFSTVVSTLPLTFAANTTTTITRPANADWSNCYYKFVYNVSVSGTSNRFVEFTRAKFYAETGAASYNVTINSMMNGTVQSSHQTATPNTTVTLTPQPATNYALGSIDVTGDDSGATPAGGVNAQPNGDYTFTMPAEDVYVGATFIPASTVAIDATGITNTNIFNGTSAGTLVATVTDNTTNQAISGATVTWATSDAAVATVNNGAVTLVGAGSAVITAAYAGDSNHAPASATYTITVTNYNPNAIDNIEDITATGSYTVVGTIVAMSARGFIVGDGTGYVHYYYGSGFNTNYTVGDIVKLAGNVTTYNHAYQFEDANTTVTAESTSNYDNTPAVQVLTANDFSAYGSNNHLSDYVQIEGHLTHSGNYYNITVTGATAPTIYFPTSAQQTTLNALDNKDVVVKGYFAGMSSGHLNMVLESIDEVSVVPTLTVSALTNVEIFVFDANDQTQSLIEGGATAQSAQIAAGTMVLVSISATQGSVLASFTVDGQDHLSDIDQYDSYTFEMPNHDVTITATAVQAVNITYSVNGVTSQAQVASSFVLPTSADLTNDVFFAGWTYAPYDIANIMTAGTTVTVQGGETFYAVYGMTTTGGAATPVYEEVTAEPASWEGEYLIVSEGINAGNAFSVAFDGSLLDLDPTGDVNNISVTIDNGVIESSSAVDAATFIIEEIIESNELVGYSIQSQSGIYIGRSTNTNGMDQSDETAYANTISYDDNHSCVNIIGTGNAYLRYNATSGTEKFRYYKSSTYTGQKPIMLFKKTSAAASTTAYYTRVYMDETASAAITLAGPTLIPSGYYLDMGNYALNNNLGAASLVIADGGQVISDNEFEGTMLKNIEACDYSTQNNEGYYLITTPFNIFEPGDDVNDGFFPTQNPQNYDLYDFDPTEELEWINFKDQSNGFTELYNYRGYLYANGEGTTLRYSGTLNGENDVMYEGEVELAYDASDNVKCYTLVGNPFTYEATYRTYVAVGASSGTPQAVNVLALNSDGNAFVSRNTNVSQITLNPLEAVLIYAPVSDMFFGSEFLLGPETSPAAPTGDITVNIGRVNGDLLDNAVVSFGGSMMKKFYLNENSTRLYFPISNVDYAVVPAQSEGDQPVNFKANENGTYVLSVEVNNLEMNYLHLIDNMTGADVDLLANPSYTFEARTTDYASRFRLVFSANDLEENISSDNFAFFNGSEWVVSNTGEATLQVVDVLGRVLSTETVNGNATINVNQPTGVYMLRLVNGNNVRVQKVVVR